MLLACDAVVLVLVFNLDGSEVVYSVTPAEAERLLRADVTDRLRVSGRIVRGSLVTNASRCEFRFQLEDAGPQTAGEGEKLTLDVVYRGCVVPSTFGEYEGYQLDLIVHGALRPAAGVFAADELITRCPNKVFYQQRPLPRKLSLRVEEGSGR